MTLTPFRQRYRPYQRFKDCPGRATEPEHEYKAVCNPFCDCGYLDTFYADVSTNARGRTKINQPTNRLAAP